jgi:phage/plasmid-like protein (TIGR03299 family)
MTTTTTHNTSALDLLGADVSSLTNIDDILEAGDANWDAIPIIPSAVYPDGSVQSFDDQRTLVRSDNLFPLGAHKQGYVDIQNRLVTEIALEAVGLRPADAAVKHAGVLGGGKVFFVNIDLGSLFIDPQGINDQIARCLTGFTSHDGTCKIMFVPEMIRLFCSNQLPAVRRKSLFSAKHTKNVMDKLGMARDALGIADAAKENFVKQAEAMLKIQSNNDTVKRIVEKIWVPSPTMSDKAKTVHANRLGKIISLYEGDTCSKAVGQNRWGVYQAITEYEDHGRGTSAEKRAVATLIPTQNHVAKVKEIALDLCMN